MNFKSADRLNIKYLGEFVARKHNKLTDAQGVPIHKMLLLNPEKFSQISR